MLALASLLRFPSASHCQKLIKAVSTKKDQQTDHSYLRQLYLIFAGYCIEIPHA